MLATFTTSGPFSSNGRLSSVLPTSEEPAGAAELDTRLATAPGSCASGALPTIRPLSAPPAAPGGSARLAQPTSRHTPSAIAAEPPHPDHAVLRRGNRMESGRLLRPGRSVSTARADPCMLPRVQIPSGAFKIVKEVARHLLRRPVIGIVAAARTVDGRWLLVRRSDTGKWALPGGTLEWGETFRSAITR